MGGAVAYDLFGTTLDDLEAQWLMLLDRTIETYKPAKVWALYSGGTDSTAAALLASKHPAFSGLLHLKTGTGVPETLAYVEHTANRQGWDLIIQPPGTTSYEALVTNMGFPGRPYHGAAYNALKDRGLKRVTAKKRAGQTSCSSPARGRRSRAAGWVTRSSSPTRTGTIACG